MGNHMKKYLMPEQEKQALERLKQPFAVYQFVDKRVVTLALSDGFCELFGYEDRKQAYHDMDNDMYKDTHPDDVARIADAAERFATEGGRYEVVYRSRKKGSSKYKVIHAIGEHVYTDDGIRLAHVWYTDEGSYDEASNTEDPGKHSFEISETLSSALHERDIVKASQYDFLTGLPNMTHFFELAEIEKESILRSGESPVFLYMDFKGMKFFNNEFGFPEGNELIRSFAKLITNVFSNRNCCRIGADHFAAITKETGLEDRLSNIFSEFGELYGEKTPPLHVGIYQQRDDNPHVSSACEKAILACNTLKGEYSSGFRYYNDEIQETAILNQYIVENFEKAMAEKWIKVYLQPIIRAVNGQVCSVEALARWIDPEKGILSPASFIPALENAGLIYKLDLYMVDRVLESMETQEAYGLYIVPHSINFSRSDFDACDLVEEIRRRVDEAGVSRDRFNIEITESVIGRDFEFMLGQVERFRSLGFPVWMDDFGSGYSSLDVLQSIKIDLIKFDMSFMTRLDEGNNGRIILTELMKMASSLGMDTICEGVETEEQVRFLREIGCSKLQGFYFGRPTPFEEILKRKEDGTLIANENPDESHYYDSIGRMNLYDLGAIASEYDELHNVFDTLPSAVLEIKDHKTRFVRSNSTFQGLIKQYFDVDISNDIAEFDISDIRVGKNFVPEIMQCCENGNRAFFDERMADGSVLHFFIRRIDINPVTGCAAIAIAVLSISEPDESATYAEIASSLADDYYNIFLIDLDTNDYIEYSSKVGDEGMSLERHGEDFFESARRDTMTRIYEDDREPFLALFTKENVLSDIDKQGVFTTTYRIIDTGTPMYVNMKITRMRNSNRLILGVSIIDAHMRQQEERKRLRQEKAALGRVAALSPDYIVLYTVDPVSGRYTQYSPTKDFKKFGLAEQGEDFFADVVKDAPKAIAPDDIERHLRVFTKENMLSEIEKNGFFIHNYRIIMDGEIVSASLKATMVEEDDGDKIILGVTNDETAAFRLKLEEAARISELNKTITALLDNIPGMTFTKDAQTGAYLACNQAFAEYANKAASEDIVGLTDSQIFDAETAKHFVEDDKLASSMDKPYIFYEEVADAVGNKRQFQTTKFKYTDAYGRLCIQGMCQDVTDMVRISRENASTKEAYEKASNTAVIYSQIAHALARGYTDLFYVNMQTNELIEFHTDDERGVLSEARRGSDFFASCEREAKLFVHPDDQEKFIKAMNRDFLNKALDKDQVFDMTYRRMIEGEPFYVEMKVTRMEDDPNIIVVAVSNVDELMKKRRMEERIKEERIIYARLHAITGNFIVVYVVDPETNHYREFSATSEYIENFDTDKEGEDFFESVRKDARIYAHPNDVEPFLSVFTKENVLSEIEKTGIFTWGYRIMMDDRPLHVHMKAAMVEEDEGSRLVVGLNDIDVQVRQEQELGKRLFEAQTKAKIDGLTGVKNRHAFLEAEEHINRQIENRQQQPFAVLVLDVNDLKKVNDTSGHQVGDQYIKNACKVICKIFSHSPVFRIGGDEFVVISQGKDYDRIEELLEELRDHNIEVSGIDGNVIACGMSKYEEGRDVDISSVIKRADHEMYENKNKLKKLEKINKEKD